MTEAGLMGSGLRQGARLKSLLRLALPMLALLTLALLILALLALALPARAHSEAEDFGQPLRPAVIPNEALQAEYCFADGALKQICVGHPEDSDILFTLDTAQRRIQARARLRFHTAPGSDAAWFFLDPRVLQARLDGKPVVPVRRKAPGGEEWVIVLPLPVSQASPQTVHSLELDYEVGNLTAWGLSWEPFRWVSDYSDSTDARFINAFAPASFEADRYPMTWHFRFSSLPEGLGLQTSAARVERPAADQLVLSFDSANASGPYFELSTREYAWHHFSFAGREGVIPVHIYFDPALATPARDLRAIAVEAEALVRDTMTRFEREIGPYAFKSLLVKLWSLETGDLPLAQEYSMEYAGAIVSRMELIPHEICHQWFGRGASPRDGRAGFADELICDWYDYGAPHLPLLPAGPPARLLPANPWTLRTPEASYGEGAFMARLKGLYAAQKLDLTQTLSAFYRRYRGQAYSHADFLSFLAAAYPGDLSSFFARYVDGDSGP